MAGAGRANRNHLAIREDLSLPLHPPAPPGSRVPCFVTFDDPDGNGMILEEQRPLSGTPLLAALRRGLNRPEPD
jgi:hypothetical protein